MDEDIIGHNSRLSSLTPIGSLGHISSPCEGDGVEVFGEASELGFSSHGEDDQLPALFCNRELFIRLKWADSAGGKDEAAQSDSRHHEISAQLFRSV